MESGWTGQSESCMHLRSDNYESGVDHSRDPKAERQEHRQLREEGKRGKIKVNLSRRFHDASYSSQPASRGRNKIERTITRLHRGSRKVDATRSTHTQNSYPHSTFRKAPRGGRKTAAKTIAVFLKSLDTFPMFLVLSSCTNQLARRMKSLCSSPTR